MSSQELSRAILEEIDSLLRRGVLPVTIDHLKHLDSEGMVLQYLIAMKKDGLISGDLVSYGAGGTPYRLTNIRLTYIGIKALRQHGQ